MWAVGEQAGVKKTHTHVAIFLPFIFAACKTQSDKSYIIIAPLSSESRHKIHIYNHGRRRGPV